MKTKLVSFSYPTSPNAVKFGFPTTGCYTVDLWSVDEKGLFKSETLAPFATKEEAKKHAETLPYEWNKTYLRFAA